jgi:hypothetical protein
MKPMQTALHFLLVPVSTMIAGVGISIAADEVKPSTETSHDVTKNPITGNTTTTTKTESEEKVGETGVKKTKKMKRQKFNRDGEKIEDTRKKETDVKH